MRDIKLDKWYMKTQYFLSWIGFILFGFIIGWIIAIFLANYGKYTSDNTKKTKNLLNMTYQKFILIYGGIFADLYLLFAILGIFLGHGLTWFRP